MDMAGNDWTRCWGEVFQIYRKNGPGDIRSGDLVGLHYPRKTGKWLGCAGFCGKAGCPGTPNPVTGFSSSSKWHSCWGEVFRIYARNKYSEEPINTNDDVALFYQRGKQWVSQGYKHNTAKRPCLGKSFPPLDYKFDNCAWETFRLWKKSCC